MQTGSLGDLAQSYAMQSRNTVLKQDIQRLTTELASGQIADVRQAISGNTAYANDLERSLTKLNGYDLSTTEAGQFAGGMQNALTRIGDLNTAFRDTLISTTSLGLSETSSSVLTQADHTLDGIINAMNTSISGRSLFAGASTDIQPIAPKEDLLDGLRTAVLGAISADDVLTAAQAWFDDPAGFASIGYQGADTSLAAISLSEQESAQLDLRGDNAVFKDTLMYLATIALADDPTLGLTEAQQSELIQKSLATAVNSSGQIIGLQAEVGISESKIETASVRNSAERSSLEIARNDLLSIDPYQAATELEQVQFQLESLFAITSRMSQLSLVNFL
jgi:flagellar hook-associated protein 3 FlgL